MFIFVLRYIFPWIFHEIILLSFSNVIIVLQNFLIMVIDFIIFYTNFFWFFFHVCVFFFLSNCVCFHLIFVFLLSNISQICLCFSFFNYSFILWNMSALSFIEWGCLVFGFEPLANCCQTDHMIILALVWSWYEVFIVGHSVLLGK